MDTTGQTPPTTDSAMTEREKIVQILYTEVIDKIKTTDLSTLLTTAEAFEKQYPQSVDAAYTTGYVLSEMNRPAEALVALERALKLDPSSEEAIFGKGACLKQLGRIEEAAAEFSKLVTPSREAALYALAGCLELLPDPAPAGEEAAPVPFA
jgi:tetratricopeptide (TPR) repeat protein